VVASVGGGDAPDVVGLSGSDVVAWINSGAFDLGAPIDTGQSFAGADAVLAAGDWDRDGYGDVIEQNASNGNLYLLRGNGRGRLRKPVLLATGFGNVGKLAAVGDMTGDGYPDLMGQPRKGVMRIYPGHGLAGVRKSYPAYRSVRAGSQIGVGRWNGDGAPDTLFRRRGTLTLYRGNGPGGLYGPRRMAIDVSPYDWVVGVSDLQLTGHPDLIVRVRGTGKIYALQGSTQGFSAPLYLGDGLKGYDLVG
jgi:hypothetical protein